MQNIMDPNLYIVWSDLVRTRTPLTSPVPARQVCLSRINAWLDLIEAGHSIFGILPDPPEYIKSV